MSRLRFNTLQEAQAWADKTHAAMIAQSPEYARSVAEGKTLRWAIPEIARDADGNPTGTEYVCGVKDRVRPTMTAAELARVEETPKPQRLKV